MAPESVGTKNISLKDSLGKAFLGKHPNIELFAECIDRHGELSLREKEQWLTFVTSTYEPPGSIKKSIITNGDVAVILGIPEIKVEQHLKALEDFPNFDNLWEALEKEINKEVKKKPDLFKSLRTKEAPIPQETIAEVIKLRKKGLPNADIIRTVKVPKRKLDYIFRKLVTDGKVPARGHTKSQPSNLTS